MTLFIIRYNRISLTKEMAEKLALRSELQEQFK